MRTSLEYIVSAKFVWLDKLEYCSQYYTTEGIGTIVDLESTFKHYLEVGGDFPDATANKYW